MMSYEEIQNLWCHLQKYYRISGWTGAVNVRYRYMKKWRASHLEYPRFHTNCKHVHSCPDSCHINQFTLQPMSSNPEPSYVPHDIFAQSHLQLLRQDKWCSHMHQKPVSQAKQTSWDKPQTFLNKSKDLDHVPFFFFWWCYSYGPQQGPDRQQKKKREGSSRGESKRKLLKETQNQGKETRKKKRTQVEYRVEGAQDRRRKRKPGGGKETPNTRKRGGDAQSRSCWDKSGKHRSRAKRG